jgi:Bacterial Ig-like domain
MIQEKSYRLLGHAKALALGLLLVATVSMMLAPRPAHALTFTVNSTGEFGTGGCNFTECTLAEAIGVANRVEGPDTIRFNIPGEGVKTIHRTAGLTITDPVTIDGYTQPGASPNTLEQGTNAKIMIELDGSGGVAEALGIFADNSVVRGLAINRYGASAVVILGSNNKVEGNFIGTDPSGTQALGNRIAGVTVLKPSLGAGGASNTIGGTSPAARNLISGNAQQGVQILSGAQDNAIRGNLIGTDKSGTAPLPNGSAGVEIRDSSNNNVGGGGANTNTIAFNAGDGVAIRSLNNTVAETGNPIQGNSIFSNDGLGIDLVGGAEDAQGRTANDPQDPDAGPNNLQNKPEITSATTTSSGTTITGTLNSDPGAEFVLALYSNPSGDDEGKKLIDATSVFTDANGNATFSLSTAEQVAVGQTVTATATKAGEGSTSEFSDPKTVAPADEIAPRVNRVVPAENARGVAANANVSAFFSEDMSANTVNANTVTLKKAGTTKVLPATVSYDAATKQAILNPDANLQPGATYVATVKVEAKDLAGNRLDQDPNAAGNQSKVWRFTVKQ